MLKICNFVGKTLNEKEVDDVVDRAKFEKMKKDPTGNIDFFLGEVAEFFDKSKGGFLRKGKSVAKLTWY